VSLIRHSINSLEEYNHIPKSPLKNISTLPEEYHVGGAINIGDYNVRRAGNILTLPFYMLFLLSAS